MKTCNRCKQEKPLSEFNKKRKSGVQPYCRPCQGEYQREKYGSHTGYVRNLEVIYRSRRKRKEALIQWLYEYLSTHPCVDCGETDIRVLEFDHVLEKSFDISEAIRWVSPVEKIEKEVEKCEVRCSNCHRIVTHERGQTWRWKYYHNLHLEEEAI